MPVIDNTSPAYNQNSRQYWEDELQNLRILLYNYNLAINALLTGSHQSYELDTGQNKQRVTRINLKELSETRDIILSQIAALELHLGIRQGSIQIIPVD